MRDALIAQFFADAFECENIEAIDIPEKHLLVALESGLTEEPYVSYGIVPITDLEGKFYFCVDIDRFMERTASMTEEELLDELVYWRTRVLLRFEIEKDLAYVETVVLQRLTEIYGGHAVR